MAGLCSVMYSNQWNAYWSTLAPEIRDYTLRLSGGCKSISVAPAGEICDHGWRRCPLEEWALKACRESLDVVIDSVWSGVVVARIFLLLISIIVCRPVFFSVSAFGDEKSPQKTNKSISEWITFLDSENFSARRTATRKLIQAGSDAVKPLSKAAESGNLEVTIRVMTILEAIYVSGDNATIDATELVLDQLENSKNQSIAVRASRVLAANYGVRERRAASEVIRLGGVVNFNLPNRATPRNPTGSPTQVRSVLIGTTWKGGDAGLKHVKRLTNLEVLFFINGSGVSAKALEDLANSMPRLNLQQRGQAFLGIQMQLAPFGCQVIEVRPGSAANKAQMLPRDVIKTFGGKPVQDPESLIKLIEQFKPGDKVPVNILRGGKPLTLQVVLGGWTGPK